MTNLHINKDDRCTSTQLSQRLVLDVVWIARMQKLT